MFRLNKFTFKSGDAISCKIKGYLIKNARLHFSEMSTPSDVKGWICHNESDCSGDTSPVKYGFRHSWAFHIITERLGNGTSHQLLTDEVSDVLPLLPPSITIKNIFVDGELDNFLKLNQFEDIVNPLLYTKLGIFDEFDTYRMSDVDGCIILGSKSSNKKIEIKISRFVKQMSTKMQEILTDSPTEGYSCVSMDISDKTIENIYNTFVSYQKNDKCDIRFFKGDDILKGYDKENFILPDGGTLYKSCMVGHPQYLQLYTKNPNQVQLAAIYMKCPLTSESKIAARGLVWTTTDGKMYSDRVYYKFDWIEKIMVEKLRSMNIIPIQEQAIGVVQLENWEFEYYPYVDNFYSLDKSKGILIALGNGVRSLRNTNGQG